MTTNFKSDTSVYSNCQALSVHVDTVAVVLILHILIHVIYIHLYYIRTLL